MAISFVTSGEATAANGGDPAITLGATPATDDLILCVGVIGDSNSLDYVMSMTTAGYTLVPSTELFVDSGAQDLNIAVFYKFANGTENTLTFNGQGASNAACVAVAMVFRGVDTSTPFDVTSTTATNVGGFNGNPPSIDWTTAGTAVVCCAGAASTVGASTYTAPTNYTTNARDASVNDANDSSVGMGYNLSPSDPEDPGAWTHGGTDNAAFASAGITIALRPSAGATPVNLSYSHVGTLTKQRDVTVGAKAYSHAGTASEIKTVSPTVKAYSHVGNLTATKGLLFQVSKASSHVASLVTSSDVLYVLNKAYSHIGILTKQRTVGIIRAFGHVGTAIESKTVVLAAKAYSHIAALATSDQLILGLSKAYSHIGTLLESDVAQFLKYLASSAVHTLSTTTQFIAGSVGGFSRRIRSFGFGIGLNK
jgi:hypothetical protein